MRDLRLLVTPWWLAAALLAAAPGRTQAPPEGGEVAGESCVLRTVELEDRGEETLVEITTEGEPAAVGARVEHGGLLVLDLAGCVAEPQLADRTFAAGLVSSLQLVQRPAGGAGIAVETRQPFEYTIRSSADVVRVTLRPRAPQRVDEDVAGEREEPVARGLAETAASDGRIRVLEPLAATTPAPPPATAVLEPLAATTPTPPPAAAAEEPAPGEEPDVAEIEALVERWVQAWSGQRIDDYLSCYAAAFRPAAGTRSGWEASRRARLAAPGFIEIGLDGLEVRFEKEGRAGAGFWQSYTSDSFSDLVYKRLTLTREDGAWKILAEEVVPPPAAAAPAAAASPASPATAAGLVEGARLSVARAPVYDPSYRVLAYPGGDPGWQRGSGVDLVVRAYRQVGVDLQQRIHEDILAAGSAYGIQEPDPNIDHRRLRNLVTFLGRHARALPTDRAAGWQAGDLVFWAVAGGQPDHVGIVSDRPGPAELPLVLHHREGRPPAEEDALFEWPIRARYRWLPDAGTPAP